MLLPPSLPPSLTHSLFYSSSRNLGKRKEIFAHNDRGTTDHWLSRGSLGLMKRFSRTAATKRSTEGWETRKNGKKRRRRSVGEDTSKKIKIETNECWQRKSKGYKEADWKSEWSGKRELCKINFTLISFYLMRQGTSEGREMRLKRGKDVNLG